jgi:hypothetical protein
MAEEVPISFLSRWQIVAKSGELVPVAWKLDASFKSLFPGARSGSLLLQAKKESHANAASRLIRTAVKLDLLFIVVTYLGWVGENINDTLNLSASTISASFIPKLKQSVSGI